QGEDAEVSFEAAMENVEVEAAEAEEAPEEEKKPARRPRAKKAEEEVKAE
ncbi:hypothetical protein GUG52_14410, partial [Xanthomonas citri pv. citri]|nr:hypothetical protein [Xanthomonas citri pv. citri]